MLQARRPGRRRIVSQGSYPLIEKLRKIQRNVFLLIVLCFFLFCLCFCLSFSLGFCKGMISRSILQISLTSANIIPLLTFSVSAPGKHNKFDKQSPKQRTSKKMQSFVHLRHCVLQLVFSIPHRIWMCHVRPLLGWLRGYGPLMQYVNGNRDECLEGWDTHPLPMKSRGGAETKKWPAIPRQYSYTRVAYKYSTYTKQG